MLPSYLHRLPPFSLMQHGEDFITLILQIEKTEVWSV